MCLTSLEYQVSHFPVVGKCGLKLGNRNGEDLCHQGWQDARRRNDDWQTDI